MSHSPQVFSQQFWPNANPFEIPMKSGEITLDPTDLSKYRQADFGKPISKPTIVPFSIEDHVKKQQKQLDEQIEIVRDKQSALDVRAIKADGGKTDLSLVPWDAVESIAKVLNFGANKYAAHNWKLGGGFKWTRVASSMLRHIFAWLGGEDKDPESGLPHLDHIGCNIFFLIHYNNNKDKYPNDDRYK